jgi:hypothetical protein
MDRELALAAVEAGFDVLASTGTLTPVGGPAVTVRVREQRGDLDLRGGPVSVHAPGRRFQIPAGDVSGLVLKGARLVPGPDGQGFLVRSARHEDDQRLIVTLVTEPDV